MLSYKSLFAFLVVIGMAAALPILDGSGYGLSTALPELPEPLHSINDSVYIFVFEVIQELPPIPFLLPTLPPVELPTIPSG